MLLMSLWSALGTDNHSSVSWLVVDPLITYGVSVKTIHNTYWSHFLLSTFSVAVLLCPLSNNIFSVFCTWFKWSSQQSITKNTILCFFSFLWIVTWFQRWQVCCPVFFQEWFRGKCGRYYFQIFCLELIHFLLLIHLSVEWCVSFTPVWLSVYLV